MRNDLNVGDLYEMEVEKMKTREEEGREQSRLAMKYRALEVVKAIAGR